jgi:hypothetical protein
MGLRGQSRSMCDGRFFAAGDEAGRSINAVWGDGERNEGGPDDDARRGLADIWATEVPPCIPAVRDGSMSEGVGRV